MQPNSLDMPLINRDTNPEQTVNEAYNLFSLDVDDNTLVNSCVRELPLDVSYWNEKPWKLQDTDNENVEYWLGMQLDDTKFLPHQSKYIDNRLFTATRATVAYVFGQTAKPDIVPSKGDDKSIRMASQLELACYQHAVNNKVNSKFRLAGKNMIIRKRGFIKLRFDPNIGPYGDIVTENIDPSDIVVDRYARLRDNPMRLFHRQRGTIEEMCALFPDKKQDILNFYGIKQGRYSQMTRMVTWYECWFTYYDQEGVAQEAVCWFIPDSTIILDKQRNPNWLYKGTPKNQKIINLTTYPVKPFIPFNYMNTGRSYIDETSLFDQAKPQQDVLNKRGRQIMENADYANPRLLIDKRVMEQSDADKFVNKHPKTIGLVDTTDSGNDIAKAVMKIDASMLPNYVIEEKYDARNEIDNMFSTPAQLRGAESLGSKSPTLGQDQMIKQQATNIQDDMVDTVNELWATYYEYLIQMMKVYLDDDYWVLTRGTSGQYMPILLNSDSIDTNVKVGVQTDSTLPLDNQTKQDMALGLAQRGMIDPLTLFRDLGLTDPEERAERLQKFQIDKLGYMKSLEQQLYNSEADTDITLLLAGKQPEERPDYNEDYLNHFNQFMTRNAFQMLPPEKQQLLQSFLHMIANKAALTQGLQDSMLNPAGMGDQFTPPAPVRNERINVNPTPQLSDQIAAQAAGMPPPAAPAPQQPMQ